MKILKREDGSEATQIAIAIAIVSCIAIGIFTSIAPHIKEIVDKVITSLTS